MKKVISITFSIIIGLVSFTAIIGFLSLRANLVFSDKQSRIMFPENNNEDVSVLPTSVSMINTATSNFPGWIVSNKGGLDKVVMYYTFFEINYPDNTSILVDTAVTEEFVDKILSTIDDEVQFHKEGQQKFLEDAGRARYIIFTHEHNDHLAGLKSLDESTVINKALMSEEQLDSQEYPSEWIPDGWKNKIKTFHFDQNGTYSLSPGVTLIRTPGHTRGSLSVLVKLQNNQTIFLIGDTTWSYDALKKNALKPLLVSKLMIQENRTQIMELMNAFNNLTEDVLLVPSHDGKYLNDLIFGGRIINGLK